MSNTTLSSYAMQTTLDLPYEAAIEKVTAALKEQGFGILTEIDVKATLKKKLDADFRKYAILGACNPPLAHKALSTDLGIGLLLPCNVVVYEDDGKSVVAIADPIAMLQVANIPELDAVAKEARSRLEKVMDALSA
jgi:uncharacterized protein (DUF302 family)